MSEGINNRNKWLFGEEPREIIKDKKQLIDSYVRAMLDRTSRMFIYENLPETISRRETELILQTKGYITGLKNGGKPYMLFGGLGGRMDYNYFPTLSIVENPYLSLEKNNYELGKDCVVIKNDTLMNGLLPIMYKYASLIAEVDISIRLASVNSRLQKLITADNDLAKADAEQVLKDVEEGKKIGVIGGFGDLFKGIDTKDYATGNNSNIKDLIELRQYLVASWFIELGLNANFNMKREAINSAETGMNDDALAPLIDDMLQCRREGLEEFNKMFATNITVELGSSWKIIHEEYFNHKEDNNKEGGSENETIGND